MNKMFFFYKNKTNTAFLKYYFYVGKKAKDFHNKFYKADA